MPVALPVIVGDPHQQFSVSLNGAEYSITLHWNARAGVWFMDLRDDQEDPIWLGMAVVLGTPIGYRCPDPRWPGMFRAEDLSGEGREATLEDLGVRVEIEFYTPEEVVEILTAGGFVP